MRIASLYFLAFDHRGFFQRHLLGRDDARGQPEAAAIADAKRLIFNGMRLAASAGSACGMGVLVDEQFGGEIPSLARELGVLVAMPAERSEQPVFDFQYGEAFGEAIRRMDPDFTKVLVRHNVEGDVSGNRIQGQRLRRLSDWLRQERRPLLLELLVEPTKAQLERASGDRERFERDLRPGLTLAAMRELREAGVDPHVWKLEGIDERADAEAAVAVARAHGREEVVCIVLGSDASGERVEAWLRTAASVDGFVGFAIGRSIWWPPLRAYLAGERSRAGAAADIAERYRHLIELFDAARTRRIDSATV